MSKDTSEKPDKVYRLITRSDFDGLVCAVLFKEKKLIDEILFVHPRDMQEGLIKVSKNDISTNLPYVPGIEMAFDHHLSEATRVSEKTKHHIIDPKAPSAARVVYDFYGGIKTFPERFNDMLTAVDKCDSAKFTSDDVLRPEDWVLLSFLMDSRTGLGRFKNFRISNYQLMMDLIEYCHEHSIEEILEFEDIKERVQLYFEHKDLFVDQIRENSTVHKNVLYINTTSLETIFAGNRFIKYALYPETNISIQEIWGYQKQNTVFTVGKSIFNRTSEANIGEVMLSYGGGGHANAGTCQIENDKAETVRKELIEIFTDSSRSYT